MSGPDTSPVRMLFIGQKPLGEAAWERVKAAQSDRLRVVAVCSNSDASSVWWKSNRIRQTTSELPFVDNGARDATQLLEVIEQHDVNFVLIVQYPWVLPPDLIRRVGGRVLSFHSAKLPEYRGHNSFSHALLNRDTTYTISATWVSDELDTGDIAYESVFPIDPADTALSLYAKGYHVALALLDTVLARLASGAPLPRRPQCGEPRFYRITELGEQREIRTADEDELDVKSRAFYFPPYEPAYIAAGSRRVYVLPAAGWAHAAATSDAAMRDELARYANGVPVTVR